MKRRIAAFAVAVLFCLSGCERLDSSSFLPAVSLAAAHFSPSPVSSAPSEPSEPESSESSESSEFSDLSESSSSSSSASSSTAASPSSSVQAGASVQWPSSPEGTLAGMTLEEKVGQLFILAYRRDGSGRKLTALDQAAVSELAGVQPGGIILFRENISTVAQVREFVQAADQAVRLPLFVSVDQEGGIVQRVTKTDSIPATVIPPMFEVGRTGDAALAQKVGRVLGSELGVFGFNMDFAPVCDVFSNPSNTVIGNRAFSSDPQAVAELSVSLMNGLRQKNMIPVAKHFPGHGDTDADTHVGYAVSNKTLEELRQTELIPFQAQIAAGVPAIMVAHISLPALNGDNTPATLSKRVITDLLRNEMGYNGLVITDALAMGAIVKHYGSEAAVQALQAGADLLLMPENPVAAYQAVLAAVRSGTLSEARIDESVLRILRVKYQYGLFGNRALTDPSVLGCAEHQAVVAEIQAKQP